MIFISGGPDYTFQNKQNIMHEDGLKITKIEWKKKEDKRTLEKLQENLVHTDAFLIILRIVMINRFYWC